MKNRIPLTAAALLLALLLPFSAGAESLRLYTASCFAGGDPSALAYAALLEAFEAEADCQVVDASMESSESWKRQVLNDFAAGNEPDVLFYFAACADSAPLLPRVVPLDEIQADYPDLSLPREEQLRENDGRIYAVPVRPYWEGLFCNTGLFDLLGLPLPTDWPSFLSAVSAFRAEGITPIAVSLSDAPHYLAEMAILSCAGPEDMSLRPASFEELPSSWMEGMRVIRELYLLGAFPENTLSMDDSSAAALFRSGQAAMRFDGSWFARSLSPEEMSRTVVLPMPSRRPDGADGDYIGGVSMGFYLTRRAYASPLTRDAAVRLLAFLSSESSRKALSGMELFGPLEVSAAALTAPGRRMLRPLQDDMNASAREVWLLDCVPAVAEGTLSPEDCWRRVMAQNPFSP